jgi:hypothetical protein
MQLQRQERLRVGAEVVNYFLDEGVSSEEA